MAGRPTKMTIEVVEKIVLAIRGGNFRGVAARWAGVDPRRMREWMANGKRSPKSKVGDFRRRVMEAEEAAEINCVRLVLDAAKKDAKHAEWWLERKKPKRWARQPVQKHEHSGPGGKPIEMKVDDAREQILSRLDRIAAARAKARGGAEPGPRSGEEDPV